MHNDKRNGRRPAVVGFAVLAVVTMVGSAAWACTKFDGQMAVSGNGGGTSTVVGTGFMAYCHVHGYTFAPSTGGTVAVSVSPNTDPACVSTQLPAGRYNVNYANGAAMTAPGKSDGTSDALDDTPARDWVIDCMGANGVTSVQIGTMKIRNGSGSGTYALPNSLANGPTDESAVCVADARQEFGLQGPISITL